MLSRSLLTSKKSKDNQRHSSCGVDSAHLQETPENNENARYKIVPCLDGDWLKTDQIIGEFGELVTLGVVRDHQSISPDKFNLNDHAIERYSLYSAKRKVVRALKQIHQDSGVGGFASEFYPSCSCKLNIQSHKDHADFYRSERGVAYTKDLISCSKIWVCPVCGSVSNKRNASKLELMQSNNARLGGHAVMLTLTIPDDPLMTLKDLLSELKQCRSGFRDKTAWRRAKERLGVRTDVWCLELEPSMTRGWRPHFHTILFVDDAFDARGFFDWSKERWDGLVLKNCESLHLDGLHMIDHFDDVKYGAKDAKYIGHFNPENDWYRERIKELADLKRQPKFYYARGCEWKKKLLVPIEEPKRKKGNRGHFGNSSDELISSLSRQQFAKKAWHLDSFLCELEGVESPAQAQDSESEPSDLVDRKLIVLVGSPVDFGSDNQSTGYVFIAVVCGGSVSRIIVWMMLKRHAPPPIIV